MEDPIISVIVPVYNTEKYLNRCVDSIIAQTYKNLRIILVDDGSTDNSSQICDEYAAIDSRIHVIHKENAGVSVARNIAIEYVLSHNREGYLAFVDSDDYIMPNMYALLYHCMIENKVDIAVCNWQFEDDRGNWVVSMERVDPTILGSHKSIEFEKFHYQGSYEDGVVTSPWNKLYPVKAFEEIRFQGSLAEDEEVNDKINSRGYRVYVLPDQLYIYCQNNTSASHRPFDRKRYHHLEVLENRLVLFENEDMIVQKTARLYCNLYIEYYFAAKTAGIKPYENKAAYWRCKKLGKSGMKTNLRFLLFGISPKMYDFVITKFGKSNKK